MSDRPWFIRIRTPVSYRLEPYSPAGWISTAVFVIGAIALGAIHRVGHDVRRNWIVWGILFVAWTIGYLILAFRNSKPAELVVKRARKP
jgi:hypothetical protein